MQLHDGGQIHRRINVVLMIMTQFAGSKCKKPRATFFTLYFMAIFDLCAQINDSIKLDYQTPAPPGLHILYKLSTELLSQTTTLIIKKNVSPL